MNTSVHTFKFGYLLLFKTRGIYKNIVNQKLRSGLKKMKV